LKKQYQLAFLLIVASTIAFAQNVSALHPVASETTGATVTVYVGATSTSYTPTTAFDTVTVRLVTATTTATTTAITYAPTTVTTNVTITTAP
jgi:hypothetical protein